MKFYSVSKNTCGVEGGGTINCESTWLGLTQCYKQRDEHEKYLYNQTSHYREYGMHYCQSARPSYLYKSGCVALT